MTRWTIIRSSLRFYWRTNIGVVLGAALSAMVLVGALVIGDSVRYSLNRIALVRLGKIELALTSGDRFFRAGDLAGALAQDLGAPAAPVLQLRGTAAMRGGSARINRLQILGVDARFWDLGATKPPRLPGPGEVVLNGRASSRLGAGPGATVIIYVEKPGAVAMDVALSGRPDRSLPLTVRVAAVASDDALGDFNLLADMLAPSNAFLSLSWLQAQVNLEGRANLLLAGGAPSGGPTIGAANDAVRKHFRLADAALSLRDVPGQDLYELVSDRVFIDPVVAEASSRVGGSSIGILTYFVNELGLGARATPYSMVAAVGRLGGEAGDRKRGESGAAVGPSPGEETAPLVLPVPPGMGGDEIIINTWLADDLGAEKGSLIDLVYHVLGPGNRLETRARMFRVRSIVPIEGPFADRTLMPEFPGLAEPDNCREWEPGIPIDATRILDKDQSYWNRYRGTPKAFVTLKAGRAMWGNRYGNLTAVRFPAGGMNRVDLEEAIRSRIDPSALGFFFHPVRDEALRASGQALDFGQLFLGLSMFLLFSALLLMALLFVFGVEHRAEELGTLLGMGMRPREVRRLLLAEASVLAAVGSVLGLLGGLLYTPGMLLALKTVWRGATGGLPIRFHAEPLTVAIGLAASIAAALAALAITVFRQMRAPVRELLAGTSTGSAPMLHHPSAASPWRRPRVRRALFLAAATISGAVIVLAVAGGAKDASVAMVFFIAGALLLTGSLAASYALLEERPGKARLSLPGVALRNATRRRGRSLAVVALLACGTFMVVAVGANRRHPPAGPGERGSGTGGFALWGESALPIHRDLNDPEVRRSAGLDPAETDTDTGTAGFAVVPLRVREGDDASCLNLNRPQQPLLMGVDPDALASRGAFGFSAVADGLEVENPWLLLEHDTGDGAVPAIADHGTILWSLGKSVGDTVTYTDERGRPFSVRLVAALEPSILQGGIVISEDTFLERYPSTVGYRLLLIDTSPGQGPDVARTLARSFQREGLELTSTAERLAAFFELQNTYLSIFQLLGGLGMLIGTVGLGLVVLRNVLERRGELGLLRAVGFTPHRLRRLLLWEHGALLLLGLLCGTGAALVAVWPAMGTASSAVGTATLGLTALAIAGVGLLSTWLAATAALRGPLIQALRNE